MAISGTHHSQGASNTPGRHATSVARKDCALDVIRRMVAEEGDGPVSLGAHMGTDKSYVSRVLNGECPLSVSFILGLPLPIRKRIAKVWFEYLGGVGEYPDADTETALRHLLRGSLGLLTMFGVLSPRPKMAKATLPNAGSDRKVKAVMEGSR